MSDRDQFSAAPYDLSEAALKELYDDQDADRPDEAEELIGFTDDSGSGPRQAVSERVSDSTRAPVVALPSRERKEDVSARVSSNPSRRSRVAAAVALIAGVLVLGGSLPYPPIRTHLAAYLPEPSSSITGLLRVADLAAGHAINPGETYGVDIPPGRVQIAVLSGQVAVASKNGASLRPCSNRPFTAVIKGARSSENPLISSCGGAQAFIQAVIPLPPIPSSLPATISPSMKSGDN